ncbi:MAG TPA: hypothetical protein VHV47_07660 [Opitutaceae bacterium]|nr:hypothetical protein [Opitutaceae bacterium]
MDGISGGVGPRSARAAILVAALGAILLLAAARATGGPFFTRRPSGYYGFQTAGFRSGHLYADLVPHPALAALPDPYDPVANAPFRVLDLAYWNNRYYLYHGAVPILLLFWPLAAATGSYPSESLATALFAAGALAGGTALLAAFRRRHFPGTPGWIVAAGSTCLLLATPLPILAVGNQVYQVPIACAACLQMACLLAIFRALHAERRAAGWLAAASLAFGLSVGARPDYLLAGAALAVPALALIRRAGGGTGAWLRYGAALLAPAGLCGAALAAYNWKRFGSVAEFGWHYQLAGASQLHVRPFAPAQSLPHGLAYLFAGAGWERYFPYFVPAAGLYGIARYLPWIWLAPGGLFRLSARSGETGRGYAPACAAIAIATAANFAVLSAFFAVTDRYVADFSPGMVVLGGIGAQALLARFQAGRRPWRGVRTVLLVAAIASAAVGLADFFADTSGGNRYFPLARAGDWPAATWEQLVGARLGGLRLVLELPAGREGATEPIFETGSAPDRRDWLQISYLPGRRARLGFFHAGLGLVSGPTFEIPPDRRIELEARCGSLYPPYAHPAFRRWSPEQYDRLIRDLRVEVGSAEVLRAAIPGYPAPPRALRLGARAWSGDGVSDRFSGRILASRRLPLDPPTGPPPAPGGPLPVELSVVFPATPAERREPLLSWGEGLDGDMFYCIYDGPGRVQLGFDHADSGGPTGAVVSCDPARPHRVKLWLVEDRVMGWIDGALVLDAPCRAAPAAAGSLRTGLNPFPSADIARRFTGLMLAAAAVAPPPAPPPAPAAAGYGAVDADAIFPSGAIGSSEPLVVTGGTGAGDFLFVHYLDRDHLAFGFDHWGAGGPTSAPIRVDGPQPHRLEVSLGSLYAAAAGGPWSVRLRVVLDGTTVFNEIAIFHAARPNEIFIGRNPIGGTTCGPAFTGRILRLVRPASPGVAPGR